MIIWAITQVVLIPRTAVATRLSSGALTLDILALSLVGAAVGLAVGWSMGTPLLSRLPPARLAIASLAAAIYLTAMTLGASLAEPLGPWSRVTRPSFTLSTLLLALLLGWVIATDPFDIARTRRRIYLSPAEYSALPPEERAMLRPAPTEAEETHSGDGPG